MFKRNNIGKGEKEILVKKIEMEEEVGIELPSSSQMFIKIKKGDYHWFTVRK